MPLNFTKMHGLGNDFVVIDGLLPGSDELARQKKIVTTEFARKICDRRFGVGADQVLWIVPPVSKTASAGMGVLNADGSVAEMCGNGIRAVALYLDKRLPRAKRKKIYPIETLAGLLEVEVKGDQARVMMGLPRVGKVEEELLVGIDLVPFWSVSVGNPHAVIFVEDVWNYPAGERGPIIEKHARFPKRTNVEFVRAESESALDCRVWERGAGLTLACGTGACAAAVAAIASGRCKSPVEVKLPGGSLVIEWAGAGKKKPEPVYMSGPAEEVFQGEWRG
jgi:diaminopimelate epimerase